ncbi:MAG: ABC transporter substrate-binding protein [Hyphomicrobiaceae bacterium]
MEALENLRIAIALTLAVLLLVPVQTSRAAGPPAKPQRIVSLNLCTDQLLVDLVPRQRIAAVSHLAADPTVSAVDAKAAGIPTTRGEAESVLAFDPDLVLAGAFSTPATVSILQRVGRRVVRIGLANDLDAIRRITRTVAEAVGEPERGEALLATMDRRITANPAKIASPLRPTALVYQVNGLSAGRGTLADTLLQLAGLTNRATTIGLGPAGRVDLETLVAHPPDLVILTGPKDEYRTAVAENLRHPALSRVIAQHAGVTVPWRTWLCGTPHIADAVERLAAARARLTTPKAQP